MYIRLLPESPRWLISVEKYSEAEKLLKKMARINGKPEPIDLEQKLRQVGKKLFGDENEQVHNAVWVFLKNPGLRKNIFLVTINWMSCAAVYYGIHLNLYNFSGNEFLNFFLLAIIELPAYLVGWYCVETRFGRRLSFSIASILCGLALCIPSIVPSSLWFVTNAMTLMGKFCTTIGFMIVYQQAAEIYPTSIRNQGMGVGSMASSVVGIAMPHLVFTVFSHINMPSIFKTNFYRQQVSHVWIPLTVLGLISIVIGAISTLLPETLNVNLPQTIAEGNVFGNNQKYFSWAKYVNNAFNANNILILKYY